MSYALRHDAHEVGFDAADPSDALADALGCELLDADRYAYHARITAADFARLLGAGTLTEYDRGTFGARVTIRAQADDADGESWVVTAEFAAGDEPSCLTHSVGAPR